MKSLPIIIIFSYLVLPTLAIPTIVTRLIHHQSLYSPNSNDFEISIARIMQLRAKMTGIHFDTNILASSSIGLFAVELSIGEPILRSQKFVLDTGSSLFWVGCTNRRFYNYMLSLTYASTTNIDCNTICTSDRKLRCTKTALGCYYIYKYASMETRGALAFETFTFKSTLEKNSGISIPNIMFGCAREYRDIKMDGILGMGTAQYSLLSQTQVSEFSYCIGNLKDEFNPGSVLVIGPHDYYNDLLRIENSTPFALGPNYYVNLTGIRFDGQMLHIDETENQFGNTIFDLGSTYTVLQPISYENLRVKLIEWMERITSLQEQSSDGQLCYKGTLEDLPEDFPLISFHFNGGATLDLDVNNIFTQRDDTQICWNFITLDRLDVGVRLETNLIGVRLQQYHYMKYDLVNRRIYMALVNCEGLID